MKHYWSEISIDEQNILEAVIGKTFARIATTFNDHILKGSERRIMFIKFLIREGVVYIHDTEAVSCPDRGNAFAWFRTPDGLNKEKVVEYVIRRVDHLICVFVSLRTDYSFFFEYNIETNPEIHIQWSKRE